MTGYYRHSVVKKLLLAVWAMLTLVLIFAVGLLVYEMVQSGQEPLSALRVPDRGDADASTPRPQTTLGTREMILYFATGDGQGLAPEAANFEYTTSTLENCRSALDALVAGPRDLLTRVVPPTARIRALYLRENGELVIDFSRELQSEATRYRSAIHESLFVYGVVNTVTQSALRAASDPGVRAVRFLIEGAPPTEAFPAHLDLRDPIAPDPSWIVTAPERQAHG